MLHDFLSNHRDELINRCIAKVALRPQHAATEIQLRHGVPMFLDQLISTLEIEQTSDPMRSREISGAAGGDAMTSSVMGVTAARHGKELLKLGYSVDDVVHNYGDLCQSITDLAFEKDTPFSVDEFRTLNRCLDNAIADAVTEFTTLHNSAVTNTHVLDMSEQLGFFAHELRNYLGNATLAFMAAKSGNLSLNGATGAVLERSLIAMRGLIDSSLAEVRMAVGGLVPHGIFSLAAFITEVRHAAVLEAAEHGCSLRTSPVDPLLAVTGDRDLLFAAVGNLLQNAFKFTQENTEVTLNAFAFGDRIIIEVRDHCGGLPAGNAETMFSPFTQRGEDRTGLGLGLSITRRSVESNGGIISVRDIPGTGCVFSISLPRHAMPETKSPH